MHKFISISVIILLLLSATAFAKEIKVNDFVYIFADKVNVRDAPSTIGNVLCKFLIGDMVRVLEKSEKVFKVDDIEANWYKVSKGEEVGYVWGGAIADFAFTDDFDGDDEKETFLLRNLTSIPDGIYDENYYDTEHCRFEIRIARDSKLIYETNEKYIHSTYTFTDYKLHNDIDLEPNINLLGLKFEQSEFARGNGEYFFIFKDESIKSVFKVLYEEWDSSYAVDEHCKSSLIFPKDEEGQANRIIIDKHCAIGSGDEKTDIRDTQTIYYWNGDTFLDTKETEVTYTKPSISTES